MTAAAIPAIAALVSDKKGSMKPFADALVREAQKDFFYLDANGDLTTHDKACVRVTNGTVMVCGAIGVVAVLTYLYSHGMLRWDPFGLSNIGVPGVGLNGASGKWIDVAQYGSPLLAAAKAFGWLK